MSNILVIAEHDGQQINPSTAKSVTCATVLKQADNGSIDLAVFAHDGQALARAAGQIDGVDRVLLIDREENAHPLAATLAPQIAALSSSYSHVLAPSTTFGKDVLPRAAALAGQPQVSDIMEVLGPREFKRPVYAGNAIVTVVMPGNDCVFGTVRTASFPAASDGSDAPIESTTVDVELPSHSRYLGVEGGDSDRPDLQTAPRVVSGGRALGSEENFEIIFKLADALNAGVGASRAAVDAGYVPNELQVGQTGKIISPDLYIAVGISGAIQHLTGIKDAGTIVAINKDADAPIFEVADIGLVGDLFNIVPELTDKLS